MKLVPNFIKKHLPVSRKAHAEALKKVHQQADADNAWLLTQLRQVSAANIRLERKLHLGAADEE